MTQSKDKVMEVRDVGRWPISKAVSTNMHVIIRLTVNYGTLKTIYLNFNQTDF